MASAALGEHSRPGLIPAATIRTVRAATGAVLFAYILTHLINHAVGIASLDALEAGRAVFLAVWRNPVGTVLLYGSFLIHGSLAFRSLYRKRSLRIARKFDVRQQFHRLTIHSHGRHVPQTIEPRSL